MVDRRPLEYSHNDLLLLETLRTMWLNAQSQSGVESLKESGKSLIHSPCCKPEELHVDINRGIIIIISSSSSSHVYTNLPVRLKAK